MTRTAGFPVCGTANVPVRFAGLWTFHELSTGTRGRAENPKPISGGWMRAPGA